MWKNDDSTMWTNSRRVRNRGKVNGGVVLRRTGVHCVFFFGKLYKRFAFACPI